MADISLIDELLEQLRATKNKQNIKSKLQDNLIGLDFLDPNTGVEYQISHDRPTAQFFRLFTEYQFDTDNIDDRVRRITPWLFKRYSYFEAGERIRLTYSYGESYRSIWRANSESVQPEFTLIAGLDYQKLTELAESTDKDELTATYEQFEYDAHYERLEQADHSNLFQPKTVDQLYDYQLYPYVPLGNGRDDSIYQAQRDLLRILGFVKLIDSLAKSDTLDFFGFVQHREPLKQLTDSPDSDLYRFGLVRYTEQFEHSDTNQQYGFLRIVEQIVDSLSVLGYASFTDTHDLRDTADFCFPVFGYVRFEDDNAIHDYSITAPVVYHRTANADIVDEQELQLSPVNGYNRSESTVSDTQSQLVDNQILANSASQSRYQSTSQQVNNSSQLIDNQIASQSITDDRLTADTIEHAVQTSLTDAQSATISDLSDRYIEAVESNSDITELIDQQQLIDSITEFRLTQTTQTVSAVNQLIGIGLLSLVEVYSSQSCYEFLPRRPKPIEITIKPDTNISSLLLDNSLLSISNTYDRYNTTTSANSATTTQLVQPSILSLANIASNSN